MPKHEKSAPVAASSHGTVGPRGLFSLRTGCAVPRRSAHAYVERFDDEAVVHHRLTNRVYLLNRTALAVWDACDGRRTIRNLVQLLRENHDLEEEAAEDHVEQLATLFCEYRLLEVGA